MLNKELFVEDPTLRDIPNLGVAKLGKPDSPQEWETLQFELSHFVCDGAYAHGLDRILSSYLTSLSAAQQPAAWVSGFYGSGKSHFLRVLEHLWLNTSLPDGSGARGLVNSPEDIALHLRELDNAGKRAGGVWAAAGTMGAGASGSARLAFLRILFLAAELPASYPAARFVIWLRQQGLEDRVRQHVEEAGKSFDTELRNMYVSPFLATAVMESVPGIADTTQAVRQLLKEQYPQAEDVTNDELLAAMDDVMQLMSTKPDARPCTLVILDELQQYIGMDSVRTADVQEIVEAVQSQFGSLVTFVAAGQSAMGSHPQLQKLQGRFTTRVEFADTDVDSVVRQVILRKKPDAVPTLKAELDRAVGEISRHLQGTKLAPLDGDDKDLVADYPLLPTRRRFWEHVLRAIDTGGTASQLRTQLRIVQEAAKFVAEDKVGIVVPADFIYEQQATGMLYAGVLTRDAHETIEGLRDGSPDGGIAHRVAAIVFLLNQLKQANPNLGVRSAADTISDLLVSDLSGGGDLRRSVESTLKKLVDQGALTAAGDEYNLETPESAEWMKDFRARSTAMKGEAPRLVGMRSAELQKALQRHLGSLMVTQGDYKVSRKGRLHLGQGAPKLDDEMLPVWVRDEWEVSLKAAEQEAIRRGPDDPLVHLLLPKEDAQAISEELVKLAAASDTLDARAMPTTDEGVRARAGIETIRQGAQARVEEGLRNAVNSSRVFLSGGREFTDSSPKTSVEAALRAAAERVYPKFGMADNAAWASVVAKAPDVGGDALRLVDWDGTPESQPVCAAVMSFIGGGKRGQEIVQQFESAPYGWPRDAIDAALLVLSNSNVDLLRVEQNGLQVKASQLNRTSIGKSDFKPQSGGPVAPERRIELRKLFQDAGISCKAGDETAGLGQYLQFLKQLAQRAGGEPPRPTVPDAPVIVGIQSLSGNEQLNEAWSQREQLDGLRLDWQRRATEADKRMTRWERLDRLTRLAMSLPAVAEASTQMQSIIAQRSLLDEPDATVELLQRVASVLRDEIRKQFDRYSEARQSGVDELFEVEEFKTVPTERQRVIVEQCGLGPLAELQLETDDEILRELEQRPLRVWRDLIAGMRQRIEDARELLAKELEPKTVKFVPPSRTLKSEGEVDAYLADVKTEVMKHVAAGNPVIVSR